MSEWQYSMLSDLMTIIGGGTPKTSNKNYWNGDIPWLSVVDFNNDERWVSSTEKTITQVGLEKSSTKLLNEGDIIISARGTVGQIAQLSREMAFNQSCYGLRAKEEIGNDFLYYLVKFSIRKLLRNTHGGVFDTITRETFNLIENLVPVEKEERDEIAKTLSNLDQKITLLRQQNQDLEELAQTLFKRWFVEFEFPCLPSGYRPQGQVNLSDMAKVCTYNRVGGLPAPDGQSWFIYVLLCEDGSFYKGMTNDLYRRFYEHYTGDGAKHTITHKPVKVIHWEQFDTQDEARKREEELKTGYGRTWLQREYDKLLKYGSVASDGLPAQNEGRCLPAHQTRLMTAGKMVESELGEIPEGWRVGCLGDEFTILMGQSPDGSSYNENKEGVIFYQGRTDFGFRFPMNRLYTTEPKRIAKKLDVLVSVRAPVGDINMASEECCMGRGLGAVKSDLKSYCFNKVKSLKKAFDVFESEGTVFGSMSKNDFNSLEAIIPVKKIAEKYDQVALKLDLKIFENTNEIQTLTQLRDILLPKLMSGELRVKI